MAFDPEVPFTGKDPQQTEPALSEAEIRAMRGDLGQQPSPSPEPSLVIPKVPAFDADEPAFTPNTTNQMPPSVDEIIADHNSKKKLLYLFGGIAGALLLAAAGYFVVYPLMQDTVPAAPVAPTEPETKQQPIAPAAPAAPSKPLHVSSFVNEADSKATAALPGTLSRAGILEALAIAAKAAAPGLHEISFVGDAGTPIPFSPFIIALIPGFTDAARANLLFVDDFTAFIFKNASGSYPGYIASLKSGFAAEDLRAWFSGLEKSPLANYFLTNPGKFAPFKDGVVNNKYPDRYAPSLATGTSLSYLMLPQQNKVIISTSFDGLKEALRLMGL